MINPIASWWLLIIWQELESDISGWIYLHPLFGYKLWVTNIFILLPFLKGHCRGLTCTALAYFKHPLNILFLLIFFKYPFPSWVCSFSTVTTATSWHHFEIDTSTWKIQAELFKFRFEKLAHATLWQYSFNNFLVISPKWQDRMLNGFILGKIFFTNYLYAYTVLLNLLKKALQCLILNFQATFIMYM